jgi:[acyl-carrier-protein] S-malonyltransferase
LERWVVQELVAEAVLAHEIRAHGIAMDTRSGAQPDSPGGPAGAIPPAAVERLVELVTAQVTVADDDLRGYYERNQDLYRLPETRRISLSVLSDENLAMEAAGRLADGGDEGTDLDVRRGELVGPLEDAIFGARTGAVIGPILTESGWHVARLKGTIRASVVTYEEARPSIEAELLIAARRRAFDEWLERRRKALARIEPDFEHPAHPMHGLPSHRH